MKISLMVLQVNHASLAPRSPSGLSHHSLRVVNDTVLLLLRLKKLQENLAEYDRKAANDRTSALPSNIAYL